MAASNEPANKKMKMENGELAVLPLTKSINDLPPENLGQILGSSGLSVIDRLHCAQISRHWRGMVREFGWTEQKKFDRSTVFEGVPEEHVEAFSQRFWHATTSEESSHFVSLFNRITMGPFNNLTVLDLHSFGLTNVQPFVPWIAKTLQRLQKLKKLNIVDFDLADFVDLLPSTLRQLQMSDRARITTQTLEKLSLNCPSLEKVPFKAVENITMDIVIAYLPRFPRQKVLDLFVPIDGARDRTERRPFSFHSGKQGALASIGQQRGLMKLLLRGCGGLDGESLGAIVAGCQRLQEFSLKTSRLSEEALFQLAKLPNLTTLHVNDEIGVLSGAVLKALAQRGQLKRVTIFGRTDDPESPNNSQTTIDDDSIRYLVDRCKSLISMELWHCPQITVSSVKTIIAEVERRHGSPPPRTLPTDRFDSGIFYLIINACDEFDFDLARALIGGNPWLKFMFLDQREIF